MVKNLSTKVKRGDTIVEVMFAFAVFALVAILSIAMMNAGVATGERSLELVVARNEINAQAEAIRFIHSSYVSELTLPECNYNTSVQNGGKCQQYKELWETIIGGAKTLSEITIPLEISSCQDIYDQKMLESSNAFILNLRNLNVEANSSVGIRDKVNRIYISAKTANSIFIPAPLGARLVYSRMTNDDDAEDYNASIQQENYNPVRYTNLIKSEGIWVVAIKSDKKGSNNLPQYYDFRIQTCWYGSGNAAPTTLDTVIRLINPENL